jgi:hypothetical protein
MPISVKVTGENSGAARTGESCGFSDVATLFFAKKDLT